MKYVIGIVLLCVQLAAAVLVADNGSPRETETLILTAEERKIIERGLLELSHDDPSRRAAAAAGFSYSKDPDRRVSTALVGALRRDDSDTRKMAAASLGTLRPPARWAIPHLLLAMEDRELLVVSSAAYSLALLGREALPGLAKLRSHEQEITRRYALRSIQKINEDFPESSGGN